MMALLARFLPFLLNRSRRNRGIGARTGALAHRVGAKRGGLALGSLAALAAPFILRKLTARRGHRGAAF